MIVELKIEQIEIPQGLLPRIITGTIEEKVQEYAEMIENGVVFDPIQVWKRADGKIWLIDGAHRIEAHKRVGASTIKAELVECKDDLDFRIKAIQANIKHGIPLLPEEKKLLAIALHKAGADKEVIIKLFGISERTYYRWIQVKEEKLKMIEKAKELREQGKSTCEIAKELGMTHQTISNWTKKDLQNFDMMAKICNSGKISQAEEKKYDSSVFESEEEEKLYIDWEKDRLEEILNDYLDGKLTFEEYKKLRIPDGIEEKVVHEKYLKNYALPPGFETEEEILKASAPKETQPPKKRQRISPKDFPLIRLETPRIVFREFRDAMLSIAYECILYFGQPLASEICRMVYEEIEAFEPHPKFRPRVDLPYEEMQKWLKEEPINWDKVIADVEFVEEVKRMPYYKLVLEKRQI